MEQRIVDIETYKWHSDIIRFAGSFRNAKKFELNQKVFILSNDTMVQCEIVGVELPPSDNAQYIYKIELPEGFLERNIFNDKQENRVSRICDDIFGSIEEAEESAILAIERNHQLNLDAIKRFFQQQKTKK